MKIIIGADENALDLKREIKKELDELCVEYEDIGKHSVDDPRLYPDIAQEVCEQIIGNGYRDRGILCCGTGIGMCMTANKFPGIFAAVGHDAYSVERSILSNNANVLCFGSNVVGQGLAKKMITEWVKLEFQPGPSSPKVALMRDIDEKNRKEDGRNTA